MLSLLFSFYYFFYRFVFFVGKIVNKNYIKNDYGLCCIFAVLDSRIKDTCRLIQSSFLKSVCLFVFSQKQPIAETDYFCFIGFLCPLVNGRESLHCLAQSIQLKHFFLLYIAIFIRYSSTCKNASKIPKVVTQVYIHSFTSQWLIGSALLLSQLMQKTEKSNPSVLWENLHINMQWQLSTVSSPERCSGFIVLFKIKQRDTFHIYNYSALCKYVLTT